MNYILSGLEIHFEECDHIITEGSPFSRPFALHFLRPTQNPFTILLRTTTVDSAVDSAEALGLEQFILAGSIDAASQATASRSIVVCMYNTYFCKSTLIHMTFFRFGFHDINYNCDSSC